MDERIEKGLLAYEIAEREGFDRVEETLAQYGVLPADFLKSAESLFEVRACATAAASSSLSRRSCPRSQ